MDKRLSLLILVLAVAVMAWVARCQRPVPFQHHEGLVFGTVYSVTYQSRDTLRSEIEAALARVDAEFSMFNPSSTVSRVNRGEQPRLSETYREVLDLARRVSADTDGAFDVNVAPLVNAWGFGFKNEQMPTPAQVDSLLQIRTQFDFSAIAKGYGSDMVARMFDSLGIDNYMIEIGGEVVVHGVSPSARPWRIGVTRPTQPDSARPDSLPSGDLQAVLSVSDCAMATSGNYRNFYYKNGRRYAHTIDPRTGYPVEHSILSATVVAPTCAVADAYATAFMVLGIDGARRVLERHDDIEAYLIYSDDDGRMAVWSSPGLDQ